MKTKTCNNSSSVVNIDNTVSHKSKSIIKNSAYKITYGHGHRHFHPSKETELTSKKGKKKVETIQNEECEYCENTAATPCNNVYTKGNHVYYHSGFNKKSVEMLIEEIQKLNKQHVDLCNNSSISSVTPNPIYLHITSYGGDLHQCFKLIDVVERSKLEVHTIVEGIAASCGSLLSVIGKKRYMGKYASILMHQLSSGAHGKYMEIEDDTNNCKMWMEHIINIYEEHTNMTRDEIELQLTHDSWWNSDTCLSKGLIDEIWTGL
jgi:ATP-dependent protease ClpP protease subunit